jgi:uncharacterized membrane protein YphA (DoxX/SURF4 family)
MSAHTLTTTVAARATAFEDRFHALCQRHAFTFLRVALGGVFVLFGALKFFPNLSPAQAIAEMTTHKLTLGLVPAQSLLYFVAVVEVTAGLLIISNKAMRFALWLLAFEMLAILSPIVLLPGELFSGPHHLPNLLGQYILKDFILLGSVLVLFASQRTTLTPNVDLTAAAEPAAPAEPQTASAPTVSSPAHRALSYPIGITHRPAPRARALSPRR